MPSGRTRAPAAIDVRPRSAYHGGMKHLPVAHQRIAPDLGIALILAGIVLVMAIVLVVVSLAD